MKKILAIVLFVILGVAIYFIVSNVKEKESYYENGQFKINARYYFKVNKFPLSQDRDEFWTNYKLLKDYQATIWYSSNTNKYIENEAFDKVVLGGKKNIKYIMATIQNGDFFMNAAMEKITKVNIIDYSQKKGVLERPIKGEQYISKLWIMWWRENKSNY